MSVPCAKEDRVLAIKLFSTRSFHKLFFIGTPFKGRPSRSRLEFRDFVCRE